jgi:hypothetical protein
MVRRACVAPIARTVKAHARDTPTAFSPDDGGAMIVTTLPKGQYDLRTAQDGTVEVWRMPVGTKDANPLAAFSKRRAVADFDWAKRTNARNRAHFGVTP